jgi:hypothetical protein
MRSGCREAERGGPRRDGIGRRREGIGSEEGRQGGEERVR